MAMMEAHKGRIRAPNNLCSDNLALQITLFIRVVGFYAPNKNVFVVVMVSHLGYLRDCVVHSEKDGGPAQ